MRSILVVIAVVWASCSFPDFASGCGGCGPSPVHGKWGPWQPSDWDSVSCSGGYRTRWRYCNKPRPANGGRHCSGSKTESIACDECRCEHICLSYGGSDTCMCSPGYKRRASNFRRCDRITCDTSSWPSPNNGRSSCSGISQVAFGTRCIVICNRGYRINGPTSSRCGNNGVWSPSSRPNCQVGMCSVR
ncbi:PREDICTED: thrombospondin-2-like [Acropora digitifera]|uniref:thrombospondin-2-like n=1 Tax=Acropora digitifera TaxID=70779 RepID=UPI00077AA98F|nr:PREDICTED: thrombospondin-2-like [Acropora digitifera]